MAVGRHMDDRAARAVRQFSPFDYLTDFEVQHRLLLRLGARHTQPSSECRLRAWVQQARYTWVSMPRASNRGRGAGEPRVTRTSRPACAFAHFPIGRTVGGGRCRLALLRARDAEMRYSRFAFHRAPRLTQTGVGPCDFWRWADTRQTHGGLPRA